MIPYFEDAACVIYHADCRELLASFEDCEFDLAFADPPYGVGMEYGHAYDDKGGVGYDAWMARLAGELRRVAPLVLVTPGIRNLWSWPKPTWALAWGKPGSTRRSDLGGFNEWEPVLMYGKRRIYNDLRLLADCQNHAKGAGDHPCPKPLSLLTWLLERATDPGQVILDPMMGSGTTLVAAKQLNRRAVGIEIEERYCDIAARRLEQEVLNLWAS